MNYVDRLSNVTVLGAGGKMGSGILLLTAMEMADLSLKPENKNKQFVLNAIDVSDKALSSLMDFLKTQSQKAAEKKTVVLRQIYHDRADLIENHDIIDQYVFDVLKLVRCSNRLESSYESTLIFEAILEDPQLKVKILSQINRNNQNNPYFMTNTSSIPIHELDEKAGLSGRIIGFHFYNPPAVQKLVELISAKSTQKELVDFAMTYAKKLRKTVVPARDVAGFIGNGHFMRDALHAIAEVERLSEQMPFVEAVYMINKVSQDFLIRPMGIFQLIDYVGLDVCRYIMSVMNARLKNEDIRSPLLDRLIESEIKGGQHGDGSQKDGILKYERGKPTAVFDPGKESYVNFSSFQAKCDEKLGPLPEAAQPWRVVIGSPDRQAIFSAHFSALKAMKTMGAELAMRYGRRSMEIAQNLVKDQVAENENDVNTILLSGFYHAYGPINEYFN